MSQSLFTSQLPVTANGSDGAPGIVTATTLIFAVPGTISGVRFFASNAALSGTWTVLVWEVTVSDGGGAGAGTLLSSQSFSAAGITGNNWNVVALSSPVSVVTNKLYRIGLWTPQWYVATNSFFGTDLINGDIKAPHNGDDPIGLGSNNQGSFAISATPIYPQQAFSASCYFIDVTFDAGGAPVVDLAANLTATAGMTATLANQANLSASLTATAGMSATLANQVNLAANLTATGGMTAALTRETKLAANLTATGSMTAGLTLPTDQLMSVNFSATAGMSAALTIPTTGPIDPIATPVANQLLACLTEQMNTLPSPPAKIQMRVGSETGPLIGPNVDECCAGLAWVRVANVYPSWDSFPGPDNTWLPCGPLAYAVVLEMGTAFCMPWSDSEDTFDNLDPPSTENWATAFTTSMQHQTLMRRAAACCFLPTQRRAVGEWTPLSVEGGCTGGKLLVTVSVMAPCGDC
jgi:hypothetical protein